MNTAPRTDSGEERTDDLHFVPSVEDLYWMELEVFDRDGVKDFIRRLLGKIQNTPRLPQYDVVLFDCPPSFTLLSYSVLSCCDLVLIPVNPDFFASKGTNKLKYPSPVLQTPTKLNSLSLQPHALRTTYTTPKVKNTAIRSLQT